VAVDPGPPRKEELTDEEVVDANVEVWVVKA